MTEQALPEWVSTLVKHWQSRAVARSFTGEAMLKCADDLVAASPPPAPGEPNPLQSELLDIITLMPDAQVDEILAFVATLREARRLRTT